MDKANDIFKNKSYFCFCEAVFFLDILKMFFVEIYLNARNSYVQ